MIIDNLPDNSFNQNHMTIKFCNFIGYIYCIIIGTNHEKQRGRGYVNCRF